MKYFEEAKKIWQSYVPPSGQADTVEGELLRAVEKLRYEAHNNGNGNWDEGFKMFCNYLLETLANDKAFNLEAQTELATDIKRLLDFDYPYLEDDLYDRIADRIVEWSEFHKGPIKREKNPEQY
ncbi:hypothetical protein O0Q50_21925 [Priestia aryabhattai]|uniref:Uncharacterized protein n=1 Tax=Priestia aryabhattai TaxID=412384 RepID=A0AAX6ND59_PRIAR|nr:hypothetical protein [Priestia aryabhattai]MDU9693841.1 hypothetical protein [Priestia aryabhattai]